jgi:hypothetical protein
VLLGAAPALAAPANDDFENAQVIGPSIPVSVLGDNTGATSQQGEPASNIFPSVWFRWTAPDSEAVRALACGAQPSKQIAVFIGSDLQHLGSPTMVNGTPFGGCSLTFHAVAGTDYWIKVGGIEGSFTLSVRPTDPPPNDDLGSAEVIGPDLPLSVNGTTVDASVDVPGGTYAPNVWYEWTSPLTGRVEVDICATTAPPSGAVVLIYTGNDLFSLTRVAATSSCAFTFPTVSGQDYKITVQTDSEGLFTLAMNLADPPPNDDFANRERLPSSEHLTLLRDNIDATIEPDEMLFFGDQSVWFEWTAPATGDTTVDACDGEIDPTLGVYIGDSMAQLGRLEEEFSYCDLFFNAQKGRTYEIRIADKQHSGVYNDGEFNLALDQDALAEPPSPATPVQHPKHKRCKKGHRHKAKCKKAGRKSGGSGGV